MIQNYISFCDWYKHDDLVLNGIKTMDRRPLNTSDFATRGEFKYYLLNYDDTHVVIDSKYAYVYDTKNILLSRIPLLYSKGDIVCVRQSYKTIMSTHPNPQEYAKKIAEAHNCDINEISTLLGWDNKLMTKISLMCNWVKITNISIERMMDISTQDCFKEGILIAQHYGLAMKSSKTKYIVNNMKKIFLTPQAAFNKMLRRRFRSLRFSNETLLWVISFENYYQK